MSFFFFNKKFKLSTALRGLLTANRCWLSTEVISLLSLNECAQSPSGTAGLSHAAQGDGGSGPWGHKRSQEWGRAEPPDAGGTSVSAGPAWTPSRPLVEPAGEGLLCSEGHLGSSVRP